MEICSSNPEFRFQLYVIWNSENRNAIKKRIGTLFKKE